MARSSNLFDRATEDIKPMDKQPGQLVFSCSVCATHKDADQFKLDRYGRPADGRCHQCR